MKKILAAAWVLVPLAAWFPFVLDDARLDGALLAVIAATLLLVIPRRQGWQPLPGTSWILGGMAVGILPLFWVPIPQTLGGLADRAPFLSALLALSALAALPKATKNSTPWVIGGLGLAAWLSLFQVFGWDPLHLKPLLTSPATAPLAGRNHAVEIWVPFLLMTLAVPFATKKKAVLLLPAAFLCGHFGILAARIALPLSLLLFRRSLFQRRSQFYCSLFILVAFFAGEAHRELTPPAWSTQESGETGEAPLSSIHGRALLYEAGLTHFLTHPLGIGLGRFERDYPTWRPAEEARLSHGDWKNTATRRPKTPHNEFLLSGLELGWLGFLLLLFGIWKLLQNPQRASWTNPALFAFALHALVRSPLSDNGVGLALFVFLLAQRKTESVLEAPPRPRRSSLFPLSLAALALLPAPAQWFGEQIIAKRLPFEEPKSTDILQSAVRWRPWDARAQGLLAADFGREAADTQTMRATLHQAILYDPTDLFALTALFKLEMVSGDEPAGLRWLAAAEALLPNHPVVRGNRTLWYEDQAERQRQVAVQALSQMQSNAHDFLHVSYLLNALVALRREDISLARKHLTTAARHAAPLRARLERLSRMKNLEESQVMAFLQQYGY